MSQIGIPDVFGCDILGIFSINSKCNAQFITHQPSFANDFRMFRGWNTACPHIQSAPIEEKITKLPTTSTSSSINRPCLLKFQYSPKFFSSKNPPIPATLAGTSAGISRAPRVSSTPRIPSRRWPGDVLGWRLRRGSSPNHPAPKVNPPPEPTNEKESRVHSQLGPNIGWLLWCIIQIQYTYLYIYIQY